LFSGTVIITPEPKDDVVLLCPPRSVASTAPEKENSFLISVVAHIL